MECPRCHNSHAYVQQMDRINWMFCPECQYQTHMKHYRDELQVAINMSDEDVQPSEQLATQLLLAI